MIIYHYSNLKYYLYFTLNLERDQYLCDIIIIIRLTTLFIYYRIKYFHQSNLHPIKVLTLSFFSLIILNPIVH